jgi:hypothetical protein
MSDPTTAPEYGLRELVRDLKQAGYPAFIRKLGPPEHNPGLGSKQVVAFEPPYLFSQSAYSFPYRISELGPEYTFERLNNRSFYPRYTYTRFARQARSDFRLFEWSSHPDIVRIEDRDKYNRLDIPREFFWSVVAQSALVMMGYRNWHEEYLQTGGWERTPRHVTTDHTGGIWLHTSRPSYARTLSGNSLRRLPAALDKMQADHDSRPPVADVHWNPELLGLLNGIAESGLLEPVADWLMERTNKMPRPDARLGQINSIQLSEASIASTLAHIATAHQIVD